MELLESADFQFGVFVGIFSGGCLANIFVVSLIVAAAMLVGWLVKTDEHDSY